MEMTHALIKGTSGLALLGILGMAGCTATDLTAFSAALDASMAQSAYPSNYHGTQASGYGYSGGYWSPGTFSTYGGWPSQYSYGDWVGYNQCRSTGSFYTCDSNGDGYADMYGNTSDGSYASSSLRVNGRGEAFTWGSDCGCWERNRAYDGPRQPDEVIIYDGD